MLSSLVCITPERGPVREPRFSRVCRSLDLTSRFYSPGERLQRSPCTCGFVRLRSANKLFWRRCRGTVATLSLGFLAVHFPPYPPSTWSFLLVIRQFHFASVWNCHHLSTPLSDGLEIFPNLVAIVRSQTLISSEMDQGGALLVFL